MAAAKGTHSLLAQLLQRHKVQVELDETVAEYITNALDDFSPEEMVEVLASFVPEVGEVLGHEQQVQLLTQLVEMREQSRAGDGDVENCEGSGDGEEEEEEGEEASDDNVEGSLAASSVLSSNDENDPLVEDVRFLLALVPEVGAQAARYVLQVISAGSRTHAAQHLVENSSPEGIQRLKAEQKAYEHEQERKREEEEEKARALRQQMLERYADVDVAVADKTHRPVLRLDASKQKIRFRDGKVVTTKGEKVIVEAPPEYDGGSRGRVKTKGKRGVGWR